MTRDTSNFPDSYGPWKHPARKSRSGMPAAFAFTVALLTAFGFAAWATAAFVYGVYGPLSL